MKEFAWHGCTVRITKKKVRNTNLRIRPEEPQTIHVSIPFSMTYEEARQLLEEPKVVRWAERYRKKLRDAPKRPNLSNEERAGQAAQYRERLREMLPELFRKWEEILGVRCGKVTIRDTRSQWGSCSIRTKNISISVWLGAFSKDCVEYVVVHELVHLLEAGHNARFYGILDQHYPNWRSCREQLRRGSA